MAETLTQPAQAAGSRFFPVSIDSLSDETLDLDLSLKYPGEPAPTLYRARGVPFTNDDRLRLVEQGIQWVYVPEEQHAAYRGALGRRLDTAFHDPNMREAERTRVIRKSCGKLIEEVFQQPGGIAIEGVADLSRQFAAWMEEDKRKFSGLLDMSEHDFYTATHMLNVGVGCGLLVSELRPGDAELFRLVTEGGLLHDIGKREIPLAVLNKEGKLTDEEFDLIKRHPVDGYKELLERPAISPIALDMTRDHHERLDGKGYPRGLSGDDIGFAARVCAVVDVFDAITAARPYRGATHPADTLAIMAEGVGSHFDPEVFAAWRALVERTLKETPQSGMPPRNTGAPFTLSTLIPARPIVTPEPAPLPPEEPIVNVEEIASASTPLVADERRRHDRFDCNLPATAMFVRQGKPMPVAPGRPFVIRVKDISKGGIRISTPWPLTKNDVLRFSLKRGDAGRVERYGVVVRVRGGPKGEWWSGIRFIERPN